MGAQQVHIEQLDLILDDIGAATKTPVQLQADYPNAKVGQQVISDTEIYTRVGGGAQWVIQKTGTDGLTILNGSGVPGAGLGVDGDFYIDTTGNDIYGPKTGGAWGGATSLVGPQGAQGDAGTAGNDGADGLTVLNGAGVPGAGLGVDGDFYIDTAGNDIYGPKTGGAWGGATSLVGPQGAQGDAGAAGNDGADGLTVLNGSGVPGAGLGVDGDFYIDTTGNDIYGPKAGGAWGGSTSLVGPQGAQGDAGAAGNDGADGSTVLNGSGVPGAGLGANGDFYIDTAGNDIYGPKTGGAWGGATSLVGPGLDAASEDELTVTLDGLAGGTKSGYYMRINNLVYLNIYISFGTTTGNGSDIKIKGLPFEGTDISGLGQNHGGLYLVRTNSANRHQFELIYSGTGVANDYVAVKDAGAAVPYSDYNGEYIAIAGFYMTQDP